MPRDCMKTDLQHLDTEINAHPAANANSKTAANDSNSVVEV